MSWNEDELHRWLAKRPRPDVLAGSRGHDAAVLKALQRPSQQLVTCVDQTIERVHFDEGTSGGVAARKAIARTFSDLAATAARPFAALLALRAPKDRETVWMRSALLGAEKEAHRHGAELVAGDLAAASGPAALTVTALGIFERAKGQRAPGRDRAQAGDHILLTGPCGGSLPSGRHLRPEPRIAEGRWLVKSGATAMMDVSDGLAIDLFRIARASVVKMILDQAPVHRDATRHARESRRSATWHALHDGEDHELIATITKVRWKRVEAEARKRFPRLQVIGSVSAGRGLRLAPDLAAEAELPCAWTLERGGFLHGS